MSKINNYELILDVWLLCNVMHGSSVYSVIYVITAATVYAALTGPWIFAETSNHDLEIHLNQM